MLPDNWLLSKLGECVDILDSQRIPVNRSEREKRISGKDKSLLYPYYGATGIVGWIDNYIFEEELILLGEDGAPFLESSKDKAYIVKGKFWVNNHAHVLRAKNGVATNQFIMHYLNFFDFHGFVTGTTRLKLNQMRMKEIPILIPPLSEQKRIVDQIEELFTQLDAGVASLKRVKVALKRYKASVLKAAVEGRLVSQDPSDEPAEELLRRIGKKPLERDDLPVLPEGWCWVNLANLTDLISGHAFKKREYSQTGTRILQIANVSFGKIVWDQEAYLPIEYLEKFPRLVLNPGDILMALNRPILGDELKIGQVKEQDLPAILYQRVGRFDFYNPKIRPYFLIFAQSRSFINQLKKTLQGVDQPFINKPSLLNFLIPLPPLEEQHRVVAEVERLLSLAEQVEVAVESSLKLAGHQRQAILKQAFEGRLVA
jgi:type I restriction enzyme, S subunit